MDDFIARQPILNSKAMVCAYHMMFGQNTRNILNETSIGYNEFGQITQSQFFKTLSDLSDHTTSYLNFFEELVDNRSTFSTNRELAASTVIVFGKDDNADPDVVASLKSCGYKIAMDSAFFSGNAPAAGLADVMIVEFTSVNLTTQGALIKKYKNRVMMLASSIETRNDFKVAKDMGYVLFQGFFFLWPTDSIAQKEIKSLDICLVAILSELEKPEPSFKSISDNIEHDLGLSYKLLRLVNSAYMAPKYKIKSITQALTYLGTRELHQWISMLMFNGIRSEENSELVEMSLIRGKLMALVAQELQIDQSAAEPFFTGLFSLIDVILNRDMNAILMGLPLTDDIKTALLGGSNMLSELLSFVVGYEQADWRKIDSKPMMNRITPQRMVALFTEAHKWSKVVSH